MILEAVKRSHDIALYKGNFIIFLMAKIIQKRVNNRNEKTIGKNNKKTRAKFGTA
jgi:hypothetical protein